ncbi:hypothetical protein [uncultured Bacteroides sp.]|uniref:hypothetical protein n=2 Tax=uncultured Bacteroides sp. TaxID=162156 RepID=UPI0025E92A8B|nr:hypothetical protein [uncultured Bacteroides sp.]
MSITSDINAPRRKHQYPANGMPAQGISDAFPHWLVCKDFAIALRMRKMGVSRFVFSDRQHIGTETGDSAASGNTDCQKDKLQTVFSLKGITGAHHCDVRGSLTVDETFI